MRISPTRAVPARALLVMVASVGAFLGIGSPGLASASVTRMATPGATPQCQAAPNCGSLGLYNPSGPPVRVLQATFRYSGAPVTLGLNDSTSVRQDFTYIDLGTVGDYESQPNTLGLTAFDFANYGSDPIFRLEFSPAGIPSGLCITNSGNRMTLRRCDGSKSQTFFRTRHVLGTWFASADSNYVLSVLQAPAAVHHLAATGSLTDCKQIFFSPVMTSASQDWIPVPPSG